MKPTAVEWLLGTLEQNDIIDLDSVDNNKYYDIINKAKEMEKQQQGYREEEVHHILCEHTAFLFAGGKSTLTEWFEQFKK